MGGSFKGWGVARLSDRVLARFVMWFSSVKALSFTLLYEYVALSLALLKNGP